MGLLSPPLSLKVFSGPTHKDVDVQFHASVFYNLGVIGTGAPDNTIILMEITYEVENVKVTKVSYGGDPCFATCWKNCDAGSDRGC